MGIFRRHGWASLVLLPAAMVGCGRAPAPTYPTWQAPAVPYSPSASSANAFDAYARAALEEENAAKKYLDRVHFTPDMRAALLEKSGGALSLIRQGAARACEFKFQPHRPFEVSPYAQGWGLIRHALVWSIDQACAQGNYDVAVANTVTATKFGFDLTGGDTIDASLGLTIVDEARQAIAPQLTKMGAKQLGTLSAGIKRAFEAKPPLALTVANERLNMLAAVQAVQDAYRDNNLKSLRKKLGADAKDALQYLEDLHAKDSKERPGYFEGFAQEANAQAEWITKQTQVPANQRQSTGPALREIRPWRRLAAALFHAPDQLLSLDDATVARTKLLILTAEIYRQTKTAKKAPDTLGQFTKSLTIDPYTGLPFIYRAAGLDFRIYSVGSDFKDDLGEADATFSKPDLVLEEGRQ